MTRETRKSLFGMAVGSVATMIVGVASVLVITGGSWVSGDAAAAQDHKTPPVIGTSYTEKENEFKVELAKSLTQNFDATMSELEAQAKVLGRIETSIQGIAAASNKWLLEIDKERRKAQQEPQVLPGEKAPEEKAPEPVKQIPTRMSETIWNLMGTWNYTTEMLANHLKNDHDIDVTDYTREEMQIMHDNIHNGFNAMGTSLKYGGDSKAVRKTTTTRVRRGLFSGLFQRSNCLGGN